MHAQQAFERPYGDADLGEKNTGTDNVTKTDNTNATASVGSGSATAQETSIAELAAVDPVSALLARDAVETEMLTAIQAHTSSINAAPSIIHAYIHTTTTTSSMIWVLTIRHLQV